jgi:TonB-linked SusC/RagA family outer membrane protein
MRFINILFRKIRFAGLLLLSLLLITGTLTGQTRKEKKGRQSVNVILKVVDEEGNPIPQADVIVSEGVIHTKTAADGTASFKGYPDDYVSISSRAFNKNVSLVIDLLNNSTVALTKAKLYATSSDDVKLPFTTIKRRHMTGSTTIIDGKSLEMYPSTDLRNALTGLAAGVDVTELNGTPGLSAQEYLGSFGALEKIDVTSRGRSLIYMVDDIPMDIGEMPLDPNEIESVSIIKDIAAKAMFGPEAAAGIVYIKTKRGYANEHSLNINFEQGVSSIDRMPEWVSGSEYAALNNQARSHDGEAPRYTSEDITAYAKNDPYDLYHPSVNFRDMMFKNTRSLTRANVSSSGGNEIVQYHSYVGYNGEGDIFKIGSKADYNRIATRSNIDIKINDVFKVQFDFYGNLTIRRSPNYGYDPQFTSEGTDNPVLTLLEFPYLLLDVNETPPIVFPVWAAYDDIAQVPWYGVSQAYPDNPIGGLEAQGYYTETGRTGAANIAFDFDLKNIIPGLKSKTFIGFNTYNLVRLGKAEDYIGYIATPATGVTGNDTILLSRSAHVGYDMADMNKLMDYYFQRFAIYERLSYNKNFDNSAINSSLTYYIGNAKRNGIEEPQRQQNFVFTGSYTYNDKYTVMGVLNYAGTHSFDKGNRFGLFPSGGLSWVISEENFMRKFKFINFLKLRVQAGVLGNERYLSPFYYVDRWNVNTSGSAFGPISTNTWFGTTTDVNVPRSYLQRMGNPDLTWETVKEISAGFDALLMNEKISLDMTWYNNVYDGQIDQVEYTIPLMVGISNSRPWYNYNKTRYTGLEASLQFTDRVNNNLFYSFGISGVIQNSERLKYDEPNYRFEYQHRTGNPADAIFGQTYLGKFSTDAEALVIPQRFDDILHQGDLKYADLNGDNIVDDNDASMIGHSSPRLYYALNARVGYKNFELAVVGTGRAFYDIALTNLYFWNGWGDNTYSAFVRDNIGGAYPRLTYYRVNNNFVTSDFWLAKGGFFKIQNVELAYKFPEQVTNIIGGRLIRLYLRGANLLTLSKIKDVDPESINSGVIVYPLYKTFSAGIKLNF